MFHCVIDYFDIVIFKVARCTVKGINGIQFITGKDKILVRNGRQFLIQPLDFDNDNTCFKAVKAEKDTFRLKPLTKDHLFVSFQNNNKRLNLKNKNKIKKKGYFFARGK